MCTKSDKSEQTCSQFLQPISTQTCVQNPTKVNNHVYNLFSKNLYMTKHFFLKTVHNYVYKICQKVNKHVHNLFSQKQYTIMCTKSDKSKQTCSQSFSQKTVHNYVYKIRQKLNKHVHNLFSKNTNMCTK